MNLPKCFGFVILFAAALDAQEPAAAPVSTSPKAVAHRLAPPVHPENAYHHIFAVVPYVGSGKQGDPRRPMYTPALVPGAPLPSRSEILSFTHLPSDDGKMALVEFVAADPAAFRDILADRGVRVFEKGKDARSGLEAEFKKYRKDFSLDRFPRAVMR
jgi:hypothetical protein